jgi:hypothetical protein
MVNVVELLNSPLATGRSGPFLRLVLAECGIYGMPTKVIAMLDDIGAMLGFYEPLAANQSAALSGPFSAWKTDRRQATIERLPEVEALATKQRALIAFGGARPGHHVGTAEIVVGMGNRHQKDCPEPFWEVFQWAAVDVMSQVRHLRPEEIRKEHGWDSVITDDDVIKPNGRLYGTYIEVVACLRQAAIGWQRDDPRAPRAMLKPLAQHFLNLNTAHLAEARLEPAAQWLVKYIENSIATIKDMYPDLVAEAVDETALERKPEAALGA